MAKLEVTIGADSSELKAEIAAAEYKIARLRKEKAIQVKLGLDAVPLKMQIDKAQTQLNGLKKSVNSAGSSFTGMAPKVANGSNALIQFSRIAQDAPYGMVGIQNNLTATAESFSYLRNQTGSTGGALKALASSLMGTGGILLAVSLVTTGLTFMAQSGLSVGDVYDKLTGNFNESKQALQELGIEAAKSAGEQISSLKSLVATAQDKSVSDKNRLIALQKLKSEYPAYFKNLSDEKILNGDLTGIINQLSIALRSRARASALSAKAGEAASKELDIQEKLKATALEIIKLTNTPPGKQLKLVQDLNKGNLELTNAQVKALGALDFFKFGSLNREFTDLRGELIAVNTELANLQKLADKDVKASISLETKSSGSSAETSRATLIAIPLPSIIDNEKIKNEGKKVVKLLEESLGSALDTFKNTPIPLDIPLKPLIPEKVITEMEAALINLNESADALIQGSLSDTFGRLGTVIGESLATGGNVLNAIGNTLLAGLGNFLSEMGGLLIKYGTLAVVKGNLDIAIATGGPLAIAAGVAAIGVGIALKAIGGAIGSKASQGLSGGGSTPQGGNSYQSPRSSGGGSSFSGSGGGNVVFEISGQSLIGVLANSLDRNRRLGGTLGIV